MLSVSVLDTANRISKKAVDRQRAERSIIISSIRKTLQDDALILRYFDAERVNIPKLIS